MWPGVLLAELSPNQPEKLEPSFSLPASERRGRERGGGGRQLQFGDGGGVLPGAAARAAAGRAFMGLCHELIGFALRGAAAEKVRFGRGNCGRPFP